MGALETITLALTDYQVINCAALMFCSHNVFSKGWNSGTTEVNVGFAIDFDTARVSLTFHSINCAFLTQAVNIDRVKRRFGSISQWETRSLSSLQKLLSTLQDWTLSNDSMISLALCRIYNFHFVILCSGNS